MKKVIKTGAMLAIIAVLIVGGVLAAQSITWGAGSKVTFTANDCFVMVQGTAVQSGTPVTPSVTTATAAAAQTAAYAGYTYTTSNGYDVPQSTINDWVMPDFAFTSGSPVISVVLKFTNKGPLPVYITVTLPTDEDDGTSDIAGTELTGENSANLGESVPAGTTAISGNIHTATLAAAAAAGDSATFTYKLSLLDYKTNISTSTSNFNFSVAMTTTAP